MTVTHIACLVVAWASTPAHHPTTPPPLPLVRGTSSSNPPPPPPSAAPAHTRPSRYAQEPEVWDLLARIKALVKPFGVQLLCEVHEDFNLNIELAR